jgi:hypothetical protein
MKKWFAILFWALVLAIGWTYRVEIQSAIRGLFENEPEPPPPPPVQVPRDPVGPFRVLGTVVTEKEARSMYARIRGEYVMYRDKCYHAWQHPEAPPLTYAQFVKELQKGTHFPQLSSYHEPGENIYPKTTTRRRDRRRSSPRR